VRAFGTLTSLAGIIALALLTRGAVANLSFLDPGTQLTAPWFHLLTWLVVSAPLAAAFMGLAGHWRLKSSDRLVAALAMAAASVAAIVVALFFGQFEFVGDYTPRLPDVPNGAITSWPLPIWLFRFPLLGWAFFILVSLPIGVLHVRRWARDAG
jgi:choline-glycine betaine transporter